MILVKLFKEKHMSKTLITCCWENT